MFFEFAESVFLQVLSVFTRRCKIQLLVLRVARVHVRAGFSMGDVGSHWSNGLCCGDLVRDNYAADDSSGVFFFSVRVEGCVSVRRISVGQGRGRWGAATELSDSFSILSLWLQPPRWSQVVHVRLCLKGQVSDSILWNI